MGVEACSFRCSQEGCNKSAQGSTDMCKAHGGGLCCQTGVHLADDAPHARYKLSSSALSYGQDGKAYSRPELAGTPCCLSCLKQMDPSDVSVKVYARKEHIFVSEVASELHRRGRGDLTHSLSGRMSEALRAKYLAI